MKLKTGNKNGFTLIEVIVSLVILAILIIPMLSIYCVVAKVNTQSQAQQKAVNLGQNLMESFKAENLEDICRMFNGMSDFQVLNSNLNGAGDSYQMRSYAQGGYGEYIMDAGNMLRTSPNVVKKDSYLFGIEGISDKGTDYDAVITLDAQPYRDPVKYPGVRNNYQMPDLYGLNQKKVTMIDLEGMTTTWSDDTISAVPDVSESTDQQAVTDLYKIWLSYLVYLEEKELGAPTKQYSMEEIRQGLQKDIQINTKKNTLENTIQLECSVSYACNLDLNGDGMNESISYQQLMETDPIQKGSNSDRELYLFYTPSRLARQDMISVSNDGAKVKLTIVKQEGTAAEDVIVQSTELNMADTLIDTNLSDEELDESSIANIDHHALISLEDAKDRFYSIKVEIYKAGSIASKAFADPYAVFRSTWENES